MSSKAIHYIICDRCNRTEEIDNIANDGAQFRYWREGFVGPDGALNKDLCHYCFDDFRKWWIAKM
jgi:hypothetical protein